MCIRDRGVGAADLDDVSPGRGLVPERIAQGLERRDQAVRDLLGGGDVHGRGIAVIGGLTEVDVIIWVHGGF